jgi:hypothetical protein
MRNSIVHLQGDLPGVSSFFDLSSSTIIPPIV